MSRSWCETSGSLLLLHSVFTLILAARLLTLRDGEITLTMLFRFSENGLIDDCAVIGRILRHLELWDQPERPLPPLLQIRYRGSYWRRA